MRKGSLMPRTRSVLGGGGKSSSSSSPRVASPRGDSPLSPGWALHPFPSGPVRKLALPPHRPCARMLEAAARAGACPRMAEHGRAEAAWRTSDSRGARGAAGGAVCGRPIAGCCANLKDLSSNDWAILRMRCSSAAVGCDVTVGLRGEDERILIERLKGVNIILVNIRFRSEDRF